MMTARLNQDALERFFGMMRNAGGSNDHPDSLVFLHIFKLIGTYSLIKPPKGSNVTGADLLQTLMKPSDVMNSEFPCEKDSYLSKLDEIITKGHLGEIPELLQNKTVTQTKSYHPLYDQFIFSFRSIGICNSGYIARKS
ncbi:uncharacterized protein LOC129230585 [Uloborus diversus]|uniref:uncharacterized protein LOC129230585 n=1 Tax=Uloborus diversus TaxID=327109 RepID=UPI0024093F68|nr:uncharacterized protein LOC129230585 [Uloborus diversus]